jgi:hypothetical protein
LPADAAVIEAAIQRLLAGHEIDQTLGATELAQALSPDDWPHLLPLVKKAAVELALAGRLIIYSKGKPVDPTDFKWAYRDSTRADAALLDRRGIQVGPGNNSDDLPLSQYTSRPAHSCIAMSVLMRPEASVLIEAKGPSIRQSTG